MTDLYTYTAPTKPLRDWLRLQTGPLADLIGGAGAATARVFATESDGLLPGGAQLPAVAFHASPGAVYDGPLQHQPYQWDCYGTTPENAEDVAAALSTLLANVPPRTRLAPSIVWEGPAVIVDSWYLPVNIDRVARQIVRTRLTFSAY